VSKRELLRKEKEGISPTIEGSLFILKERETCFFRRLFTKGAKFHRGNGLSLKQRLQCTPEEKKKSIILGRGNGGCYWEVLSGKIS